MRTLSFLALSENEILKELLFLLYLYLVKLLNFNVKKIVSFLYFYESANNALFTVEIRIFITANSQFSQLKLTLI